MQRTGRLIGNRTKGFTLVEVMMTVAVFTVLSGACLMIFLSGSDSWQSNDTQVELQQELRKAMENIKADLVQSGASTILNVPLPSDGTCDDFLGNDWYTTITFRKASGVSAGVIQWSASYQYLLGGTGGKQLLRRPQAGSDVIVAQDMQTLKFRRCTSNVVEVSMVTQKNTLKKRSLSNTLTFEVKLRN